MSPDEILEYVNKGIVWLAVGGASYIGVLAGTNLTYVFSQRIKSQEELEKVVDEEATKLGLDSSKINVKYNGKLDGVRKNGEGYDLHLKAIVLQQKPLQDTNYITSTKGI